MDLFKAVFSHSSAKALRAAYKIKSTMYNLKNHRKKGIIAEQNKIPVLNNTYRSKHQWPG